MTMHSGLVSVSFRKLSAIQIIDAVSAARLEGVEWGGDVHVPHGELETAAEVGRQTAEAGLHVAAYGSYYRTGVSAQQELPFEKVLDTAVALGAPTIRVWAGAKGSAETTADERCRIVADARRIGNLARSAGIDVAFEYHRNTLTDTRASAVSLLEETGDAGLSCYWQPPVGWTQAETLASLNEIMPRLANLHVYQWDSKGIRQELGEGAQLWAEFLEAVRGAEARTPPRARWALLEFVKDDSLEQFQRDAAVLRQWLP